MNLYLIDKEIYKLADELTFNKQLGLLEKKLYNLFLIKSLKNMRSHYRRVTKILKHGHSREKTCEFASDVL